MPKHMMPNMPSKMPMKPMMGGPMMMRPTSQNPAINPALARLPTQAKAYGVRGTKPPTFKKGK